PLRNVSHQPLGAARSAMLLRKRAEALVYQFKQFVEKQRHYDIRGVGDIVGGRSRIIPHDKIPPNDDVGKDRGDGGQ
ncbi:MAG: hypothetical protein M3R30_00205, partial [Candidatus Eremiobacteraeota bacterium]|nr:hypothetical protein [Candidatus Eremiobacteraeota bacterium]